MGQDLSVTQRINEVKQPRGGYLPIKSFEKVVYDDGRELAPEESIGPGTVGTAVDCLTRLRFGSEPREAFSIAIAGARKMEKAGVENAREVCEELIRGTMAGDTDEAIAAACKLAGCFDAFYRSGHFKNPSEIEPDAATIGNIRTMLNRCETFIQDYQGPILLSGFTFEGGYTETVSYGDGDYLLVGGLFDFKVMKGDPKPKHTLQILMYYLMGLASAHPEFKGVNRIGFFNPRLNAAYFKKVTDIPEEVIREVSLDVIGYGEVPEGAGEEPSKEASIRAALGLE